jgi:ATP-dependent Lon protease
MSRKKNQPSHADVVTLPLLPLKDAVVFPRMVVPLFVGRHASLAAVDDSVKSGAPLFLCTQHKADEEEPGAEGLYRIGTAAKIINALRMPDGSMKIVVEGLGRGRVLDFELGGTPWRAVVEKISAQEPQGPEVGGRLRAVLHQFEEYVRLTQRIAPEIYLAIQGMQEPDVFADTVCAFLFVSVDERQDLLETLDVRKRLDKMAALLEREIELAQIEQKVRNRVREQMERGQRAHYLQEQMKAIQQELGQRDEDKNEYAELREMVEKAKMPKEIGERALRELSRYERLPYMSPEGAVVRGYLEWLCDMPWSKRTRDRIDIARAKRVLDEDHYGLDKVKERILEFLSVRKLSSSAKGPILCLVGPPGVGKTSLGQSVSRAMGRKFVRVSLGGVRDEAEIRGHRRTYVGALPGRIVQGIKQAGVINPVFMLDEIDKMSVDFRGDPSSALLEVLDPAQNRNFSDHFMEVGLDLSEVFFITTANSEYDIPYALHDRMEIVRLPGYTMEEKAKIATRFLIPRQLKENGIDAGRVAFETSGLDLIIQRYTREAGVRELERTVAGMLRKVARQIVEGKGKARGKTRVNAESVLAFLGPPVYTAINREAQAETGVSVGMAWTPTGGDILRIETSVMPGKGGLILTGQLGDVMKESATAAYTYLRAHAEELGISTDFHRKSDMHVHVPEGAIPKDGPSAGLAMIVSMLSALSSRPPLAALSMTGEITLRGRVLPVGGIKEKVLAARRAGITRIILPKENEKDFPDLPKEIRDEIRFDLVDTVEAALKVVFSAPVEAKRPKPRVSAVKKAPTKRGSTKR